MFPGTECPETSKRGTHRVNERLPKGTADPLTGPTRQAAIPTVGTIQLAKVTLKLSLTLVDFISYTAFARKPNQPS